MTILGKRSQRLTQEELEEHGKNWRRQLEINIAYIKLNSHLIVTSLSPVFCEFLHDACNAWNGSLMTMAFKLRKWNNFQTHQSPFIDLDNLLADCPEVLKTAKLWNDCMDHLRAYFNWELSGDCLTREI